MISFSIEDVFEGAMRVHAALHCVEGLIGLAIGNGEIEAGCGFSED